MLFICWCVLYCFGNSQFDTSEIETKKTNNFKKHNAAQQTKRIATHRFSVNEQKLQDAIFNFINFSQKVVTIAQKEMWKIKSQGGITLINMQIKSDS